MMHPLATRGTARRLPLPCLHRCSARASCASWALRASHRWQHQHSASTPALEDLRALLQAKSTRLAALRKTQQLIHTEAHRYPDRYMFGIFGFLVLQLLVLFDWTYIHFDWNLVEPITYLLGYSATWIALAWYGNMQQEFRFDSLRAYLEHRRAERLFKERNFSVEELSRLEVEVSKLQKIVGGLERE